MSHVVSLSSDWSSPLVPPTASLHDSVKGVGPAIEAPMPMFSPVGTALGQNKFTQTVLHKGLPVVLDGHDVGAGIPHVSVPIPDPLNALHIAGSSRKVTFSTTKTLMQNKRVASCTLSNWPPTPMLTCAEPVPLPTSGAPTSHLNSVRFGMTVGDYIWGFANIAIETVIAVVDQKQSAAGSSVKKYVAVIVAKWAIKNGITAAAGLARSTRIGDNEFDAVKVGIPGISDIANAKLAVKKSLGGDWSVAATARYTHGEAEASYNEGEGNLKASKWELDGDNNLVQVEHDEGRETRKAYSTDPRAWGKPL